MSKPATTHQLRVFAVRSLSYHLGLFGWMMWAHVGRIGAAVVWTCAAFFFLGALVMRDSEE